jgi:hypothetical protein
MSELVISGAVGAPPSPNAPADVRIVQEALRSVDPPLIHPVGVTGIADAGTLKAIEEFQKRFLGDSDGVVEPGGQTLMHLSDGFAPDYKGCNPRQRAAIDRSLMDAQKWLDEVRRILGSPLTDATKRKIKNIFHIEIGGPDGVLRYALLLHNYSLLRKSFDQKLSFVCEPEVSAYGAWVVGSDPAIHLPLNHFSNTREEMAQRLIHERAHTVLRVGHGGMTPSGSVEFGVAPDDPNLFTYEQAIDNAYCWAWLATALQMNYRPADWM